MITSLAIALLLVVFYLGITIWRKKELPESISALVYDLPKKRQWVWSAWFAIVCALLFIPIVERLEWLGWLTEVCLLGCAVTPLIKPDTRKIHYALAYTAGALTQVDVAVMEPQWLGVWMLFVFLMGSVYVQPWGNLAKIVEHKGAFVAEVCCGVGLLGCLIVN